MSAVSLTCQWDATTISSAKAEADIKNTVQTQILITLKVMGNITLFAGTTEFSN